MQRKAARGGASTGFHQLTIDDFDNVQTVTVRGTEIQSGEIDGTTYYLVENVDQLRLACGGQSGEKFVLLSDIDLNGVTWTNYTNNATIDGNGHVVKNYFSSLDDSGLIYENQGTIKNLGMENCSAIGFQAALLCNSNGGTISDCYVRDSTVFGVESAILCQYSNGTISDCYVTDSTVSGEYSAILCNYNGNGIISDCYALNITADSSMKYVKYQYSSVNNCYQNHNESDPDATYKDTEWFATDAAVSALGSAYELVDGKDHPTLKNNPEPAPAGSSALRIQTGYDGTTNSYLELDLGFDLGTITVDLSSATSAANSITTIDNYLNLLNDKQSIIGKDYNRLESAAQSNTLEIENMAGAKSIIVDADTAKENSEYIKTQILQNAATSLLAQTVNINSQIVLGLLTSL